MPTHKNSTTRDADFEKLIQPALEGADMHCAEDVILYVGKTGRAKSTCIAYFLGCELQYEMHEDGYRRKVTIKRIPEGITPPEIGQSDRSHTRSPAPYVDKMHNVVHGDLAGIDDNRDKDTHFLTVLATQVGVKTTKTIKAIAITIRYEDFNESKLSALSETFKVVSNMFKERLPKHAESLRIIVTHVPEKHHPKSFVMARLSALAKLTKERLTTQPTEEDLGIDYYLSFFLKEGADQHVFLFEPLTDATRNDFFRSIEHTPSFPSTDMALIGSPTMKQEFVARMEQTFIQSTQVFDILLNTPKQIEDLKKEELYFTKLSEGFTTEFHANASVENSNQDLDRVHQFILQKDKAITEISDKLTLVTSTLETLRLNISTLENRTEEVVFLTLKYNEADILGDTKKVVEDIHQFMFWETGRTRRPENSIAYEHSESWSGAPFTRAETKHIVKGCEFGGSLGTFEEDPKPKSGEYKIKYKGPEKCSGGYTVDLIRPYNEQTDSKLKLASWKREFEKNEKLETELLASRSAIETVKLSMETGYNTVLLARANKQVESESLAFTLKMDASKTAAQDVLRIQETLRNVSALLHDTLKDFYHDQPLYQQIKRLDDLINLNSSVCETFRLQYVKTLHLLNVSDPNANMTRCHPEPAEVQPESSDKTPLSDEMPMSESALSSSPSLQEQACFVEDEPEPTTPFGFPGVDATTITCRPIMPKRPRLPDAHDANHTKPMPGLPIELEGFMGQIQHDPRTGVSVYPIYFFPPHRLAITAVKDTPFQPMRPLNHVKLYGVPYPCKSADGSQTNIVASKGKIPSAFLDLQAIEAVCDLLPPSLLDSGLKGVKQGLCRGAANVVGSMVCPSDTSKRTKQWVQSLIYNSCYFTWRCHTHLAKGKSIENTVYDAAIDTFWMCSIGLLCAIVKEIEQGARRHDLKHPSYALSFFRHTAPLAYAAVQQEVIDINSRTLNADMLLHTGAYMLASTVTQAVVESASNHYVNKLRN